MNDTKFQITFPRTILDNLKKTAAQMGVTPNILARMQLAMIYGSDEDRKTRPISLKNWHEIELFAEERGLGIDKLLENAVVSYMKKYHLTPRQKERFDRKLEERHKVSASTDAEGL